MGRINRDRFHLRATPLLLICARRARHAIRSVGSALTAVLAISVLIGLTELDELARGQDRNEPAG
jgi:hypothetical protein